MKTTLLQQLLIQTLSQEEKNSVLGKFINTIVPNLETHFSLIPALGGNHPNFEKQPDQSLMAHVLNGLITAWNLSKYLDEELSEEEQKTLCLGFTLHDYDKYVFYHPISETVEPHEFEKIVNLCYELGQKLDFSSFWEEWEDHLLDICFLAQNTQAKKGSALSSSVWEKATDKTFQISFPEREKLCELLRFGDVAVHINDSSEVSLFNLKGKALQACLDSLDIAQKMVYHRLRDCRGLITNNIHNAVVNFAKKQGWKPILYFAQGTAYLADTNAKIPTLAEIQENAWQRILEGEPENNIEGLSSYFSNGEVGFIRSGKGVKIAPLTRELFSPSELICLLPSVIKDTVKNLKSLATPKRLEKLDFAILEMEKISVYADIWADRLAEFLILTQREFFNSTQQKEQYTNWILNYLGLGNNITYEQAQSQSGGVIYGWYYVAASYLSTQNFNQDPESEEVMDFMKILAQDLANWAKESNLLPSHQNQTYEAFKIYLSEYLEVWGWESQEANFDNELFNYQEVKVNNNPICSISSGEFIAEDQLDSVVLFKPQQYSNKNALGGNRIKRGISKIWSLEMLMRQATWSAPAGKLQDNKPVFLYIFPAYVYSPQVASAISLCAKKLDKISLWDVCKKFKETDLSISQLHDLPWDGRKAKAGVLGDDYSTTDLPFMTVHYTTTMGKTDTDAWVESVFKALALPKLLGVKVVATPSDQPLYYSDQEFVETVKLDGVAGFWNLLGLSPNLRLREIESALTKLLIAYSLHLENRSNKPDARWQALNGTVREVMTDVLNIFAIANEGLRNKKRDPYPDEVQRYWNFAQKFSQGDFIMTEKLQKTRELVNHYRTFYQVKLSESSHSILLPLSKALEIILSTPENLDNEDLIFQGAGQLHDALDRQEVYKRPLLQDKSIPYEIRKNQELEAIYQFMEFCVKDVFGQMYKGDKALLQENRNRIKSGAEFAYRWLTLEDQKQATEKPDSPDE